MRILVTGAAGYIGKHFLHYLKKEKGFDVHIDVVDIREMDFVDEAIADYEYEMPISEFYSTRTYDVVYHLAASSNVDECNRSPFTSFHNNVTESNILINKIINSDIKARNLVFASSAAVYQSSDVPIVENSPLVNLESANNVYGLSKLITENALAKARIEYGLKSISLRFANVAGQNWPLKEIHVPETHLIPKLARWNNNKKFPIYGSEAIERDYININDVCSAMLKSYDVMANHGSGIFGGINISTGIGTSTGDIITMFNKNNDKDMIMREVVNPREGDANKLILDNSLAKKILDWEPEIPINETIKTYI